MSISKLFQNRNPEIRSLTSSIQEVGTNIMSYRIHTVYPEKSYIKILELYLMRNIEINK